MKCALQISIFLLSSLLLQSILLACSVPLENGSLDFYLSCTCLYTQQRNNSFPWLRNGRKRALALAIYIWYTFCYSTWRSAWSRGGMTSNAPLMLYIYTVWPEILAGNLFWRIGGFESNPPIFHPPKTYSVMSHYCEIIVCVLAAAKFASLIVGMEFTIESCVRGHRFSKEFCTPKEKSWLVCQRDEGDSNDVYTVAVKTNGTKTV